MSIRSLLSWIALLAAALPAQVAESRPPGAKEQVAAIDAEFAESRNAFFKLYRDAKTDDDKKTIYETHYPKPVQWFPRLLEIAATDARGEGAEAAFLWIVTHAQGEKDADAALDALMRDHVTSKNIGDVADALSSSTSAKSEHYLKTLEEKNPNVEVKGRALYARAEQKKTLAATAASLANASGDRLDQFAKEFAPEDLARLRAVNAEATGKEVEALLERVRADYAGVAANYGGTLGERAEGDLFEIRNLAIGKVAPEIEGEDVFGKALKLSDHRGKVIVLDFWGHW